MKLFKKVALVFGALVGSLAFAHNVSAYTINNDFNLGLYEGDSRKAVPNLIILHETANPRATGRNEATFMKRNWRNAYTTDIVGDGGIVYRVGEIGYVSYGAGNANPYAPIQIELQHTKDKALFKKNYEAYINYARDMAKKYNIPLTLDTGSSVYDRGIKSHLWVSQHVWGDHSDPYSYLASMGVSKAKLASDLKNGIKGNSNKPKPPVNNNDGYNVPVKDKRAFGNKTIVGLRKTATNFYGGDKINVKEKKSYFLIVGREEVNRYGSKYVYTLSTGKKVLSHDLDYKVGVGWDTIGFDVKY